MKAADQLRVKLTQKQAEMIFNALDLNHDGRLGYKEFCNLAVDEQRNLAFKIGSPKKTVSLEEDRGLQIDVSTEQPLKMHSKYYSAF